MEARVRLQVNKNKVQSRHVLQLIINYKNSLQINWVQFTFALRLRKTDLRNGPSPEVSGYRLILNWPLRLSVRTTGFHLVKRGSIPLGATILNPQHFEIH